jgi:hypothetical protein
VENLTDKNKMERIKIQIEFLPKSIGVEDKGGV